MIHLGVMPMHWRHWVLSGIFFIAMAVFQLIWAIVAWSQPTRWVLALGILVNGGAAVLWAMSRTAGLPFGPMAGIPETVDTAGICALLLQCYVVMGAAWSWMRGFEAQQVSGLGRAAVLIGANTVMAGAVMVGLAASVQGGHDHHGKVDTQAEHQTTPHHHPDPLAPPVTAPALPVTDMGLDTAATPTPVAPDTSEAEGDGHHHHDGP